MNGLANWLSLYGAWIWMVGSIFGTLISGRVYQLTRRVRGQAGNSTGETVSYIASKAGIFLTIFALFIVAGVFSMVSHALYPQFYENRILPGMLPYLAVALNATLLVTPYLLAFTSYRTLKFMVKKPNSH